MDEGTIFPRNTRGNPFAVFQRTQEPRATKDGARGSGLLRAQDAAVAANPRQHPGPVAPGQSTMTCGTKRAVLPVISPSSRMPMPAGAPSTIQLPITGKHPGAASGNW